MSKRYLFIVNQLFQLMVATQMRMTLFADADADLLLINSSSGIGGVYENIRDAGIYGDVFIVKRNTLPSDAQRVKLLFTQLLDREWRFFEDSSFVPTKEYDAVFFNDPSLQNTMIALYLNRHKAVPMYRFEEGLGTYLSEFGTSSKRFLFTYKVWSHALQLLGRPSPLKIMSGHYYFFPGLIQYEPRYKTFQIPPFTLTDGRFRDFVLNTYPMPLEGEFDRKYIFFEENIVNGGIDDYSLIMKIADLVGRENLMIKLHPRRAVDRFSDQGIKVSVSTGTPWEAVMMKLDTSDKVLMTISSSAALSSRLYFNSRVKTFMLYKLFDRLNPNLQSPEQYLQYMEDFQKTYDDGNFIIPENEEAFVEELVNNRRRGINDIEGKKI